MFELLAAIQSADPPSLVLWSLLVFTGAMYPLGFMLGAPCSACCGCEECSQGTLPETVTVTFDGLQDETQGPYLIDLSFEACFGSGASGLATAPGGDPVDNKGPISAVSITNGGGGYAKLGRVAPTVSVDGGSGEGATFTPSLASSSDGCGVPEWTISSVSVDGGEGYVDGEQLVVSVADGDTEEEAAVVVVNTTRAEPELTATTSPGSGAAFTVAMTQNLGSPETWGVSGVSVTAGGSGYSDQSALTFEGGPYTKVDSEANAYIYTVRSEPTLSASVDGTGSGANLSLTLTQNTGYNGRDYWEVTAVTIVDGGSAYSEYDEVVVSIVDGTSNPPVLFSGYVSSVDEGGEITGITINYGGQYYKDTGVVDVVEVLYGGVYYDDDGVPISVTVTDGGKYYREDEEAEPYVADVTVVISQTDPSFGDGAEITAEVDENPSSPTFGEIVALTIVDGGDNYLAWQWRNTKCCGDYYNGMSVVLKRTPAIGEEQGNKCVYEHRMCGVGNMYSGVGLVRLLYRGPSLPPLLYLVSEQYVGNEGFPSGICNTTFTATANVENCSTLLPDGESQLDFTATGTATASVVAGGNYDPFFRNPGGKISCHVCCRGEELVPDEIEAELTGSIGRDGIYVLSILTAGSPLIYPRWNYVFGLNDDIFARIAPCAVQTHDAWSDDTLGCDQCWKQCRTIVDATEFDWTNCGACIESPVCTPMGSFVYAFPSPMTGATVTFL